jgi:hypothetical protein
MDFTSCIMYCSLHLPNINLSLIVAELVLLELCCIQIVIITPSLCLIGCCTGALVNCMQSVCKIWQACGTERGALGTRSARKSSSRLRFWINSALSWLWLLNANANSASLVNLSRKELKTAFATAASAVSLYTDICAIQHCTKVW